MTIPGTITLSQPADDSDADADVQRSDNTAVQTAVNGLIGWATTAGVGLNYPKATSKTVNTTTSATDLLNGEITIAAGAIGTTGTLRFTATGDYLNNSGGSVALPRFQLVFGGTTLIDTGVGGTMAVTAGTGRGRWKVTASVAAANATNAQSTDFSLEIAVGTAFATADGGGFTTGQGFYQDFTSGGSHSGLAAAWGANPATAVDTTAPCALLLNVINGSANAAYETKLFAALAEII